jgi:hypothetical protein
LAAEEHETNACARRIRESAANVFEGRHAFLGRHRADDAAHDRVRGPPTLDAPIARAGDVRARHAGIHEIDARCVDAAGNQGFAYGARNGDEARHALAVLETSAGHEWDASRDDQRQRAAADQSRERNRVGARVVCVHDVGVPRPKDRAHAACGREVPVSAHSDGGRGDARGPQPANEWCIWCGDNERLVTVLTLATGEEIHLPLTAAPFSAGVQMEHAKRLASGHSRRMGCGRGSPQRDCGWCLN